MLPRNRPDRMQITFDDHRLVANAGLILPATLGLHLGLPPLVDRHLDLDHAPGRANPGDKMMTLLASALAGGDCIDAADALRTGGTARVLGCVVKAHRLLYAHTPRLSHLANGLPSLPLQTYALLRPCDGQTVTSSQVVFDISAQHISVLDCLPHTKSIADGQ